jgi:hypothetical protein
MTVLFVQMENKISINNLKTRRGTMFKKLISYSVMVFVLLIPFITKSEEYYDEIVSTHLSKTVSNYEKNSANILHMETVDDIVFLSVEYIIERDQFLKKLTRHSYLAYDLIENRFLSNEEANQHPYMTTFRETYEYEGVEGIAIKSQITFAILALITAVVIPVWIIIHTELTKYSVTAESKYWNNSI